MRASPLRLCALLFLVLNVPGCQPTASPPGPAQPQRIASLNLATDEILKELVPVERVVLVSAYADAEMSNVMGWYPGRIPRLAALQVERLLALEPDLILVAPYNNADAVEQLQRAGRAVYRYDAVKSMDEIAPGILALGERVGEPDKAKAVVEQFQARRQSLAKRLEKAKDRPRVLYWSEGFTAGSDTTIHDMILAAGARNVAAELGIKGNVEIPIQRVIVANPDYILVGGLQRDEESGVYNHPILSQLPAVTAKHVVRVESRSLSTVSHHLITGAEELAWALHPECFMDDKKP